MIQAGIENALRLRSVLKYHGNQHDGKLEIIVRQSLENIAVRGKRLKNNGDGRVITKFLKEQNAKSKKETGLVVNIQ